MIGRLCGEYLISVFGALPNPNFESCFNIELPTPRRGHRDVSMAFSRFVFKIKTDFGRCVPVIVLSFFLIFLQFFLTVFWSIFVFSVYTM